MFITRMVDQKRRYRRYKARTKQLPENYSKAFEAIERYVWLFAGGEGDSLLPLLEDLSDLFEQSAASMIPIRDVVGEDPVEFAETLIQSYPQNLWINRERKRLTHAFESITREETSP
jgi:DNA-binding ferritin-like protein (Dps family)